MKGSSSVRLWFVFIWASIFFCYCLAASSTTPQHPGDANFKATGESSIDSLGTPGERKTLVGLKLFLKEKDYNRARKLAREVYAKITTEKQKESIEAAILKVLKEKWYSEKQAVFNLLCFPALIPANSVLKYVLKALTEPKEKAYVLAATTAVAEVKMEDNVDSRVISLLMKTVEENVGAIAFHAVIALEKILRWPEQAHILLPATRVREPDVKEQVMKIIVSHLLPVYTDETFVEWLQEHDFTDPQDITPIFTQWVTQKMKQEKGEKDLNLPPPSQISYNDFLRTVKYRNCLGQFFKRTDADKDGYLTFEEANTFLIYMKKAGTPEELFANGDVDKDERLDETEWFYVLKPFVQISNSDLDKMNEDGTTPPPPETKPASSSSWF